MTIACDHCGSGASQPGAVYCAFCGQALQGRALPVTPPPAHPPTFTGIPAPALPPYATVPAYASAPTQPPPPPGSPWLAPQSVNVAPTGWSAGPAPAASTDGLGIAGFVLSLVWLGGLGSIAAVVLGHVSRARAKRDGVAPSGLGLAGLILGYVGVALPVILIIALVAIGSGVQRDQGYDAAMKSDLKSASIAEESFATDNDGAYTNSTADLISQGLFTTPNDTVTVVDARSDGYCLEATSSNTSNVWYLDSIDGAPTQVPCS